MQHSSNSITNFTRSTIVVLLGLVGSAFSDSASAVPDEFHYMVSPASCRPAEGYEDNVAFVNGAWLMLNSTSGTGPLENGLLYCPIQFSAKQADARISEVILSYIDGAPGMANNGQVWTELYYRRRHVSKAKAVVHLASPTGNGQKYGYTSAVPYYAKLEDHPAWRHIYYLKVVLERSVEDIDVAFTGYEIRFE